MNYGYNLSQILLPMPDFLLLPPQKPKPTKTVVKICLATSALRLQYETTVAQIPRSYNPISITFMSHSYSSLLRDLISSFKFRFVASSPVNPRTSELKLCNNQRENYKDKKL